MAAPGVVTPCGHHFWSRRSAGDGVALGGTQDLGHSPYWGHRFWSRPWLEVALRWSGVSLSMSTMVHLGGLVPRSLDRGHGLRCVHREEVLSGTMVASSAGLAKFMRILTLKIAWRFDGGDR
jgi:hypothetical protein